MAAWRPGEQRDGAGANEPDEYSLSIVQVLLASSAPC